MGIALDERPQLTGDFAFFESQFQADPSFEHNPDTSTEPTIIVSETTRDIENHERAERLYRSLGGLAFEAAQSKERVASLLDALRQYAETGDEQARLLIETNVRTDLIERSIKAGFVMSVALHPTESGEIEQHGQTSEQIQRNTIKYANGNKLMRDRTSAEVLNAFRMEQALRMGLLEKYDFVVLSRCPDNWTNESLEKAGFFVDTLSVAIQVTSLNNGDLKTETAFVAGRDGRANVRYDQEGIVGIGKKLGVELGDLNDAELLNMPLLVPKGLLENGAITIAEVYDKAIGQAFFGQKGKAGDYATFRQQCAQREAELCPLVQAITEELLETTSTMDSPMDAVRALHKLSQKHLVDLAVTDTSIDARVFGPGAHDIEMARIYYEQGKYNEMIASRQQAQKNAKSDSCPTAVDNTESGDMGGSNEQSDEQKNKETKYSFDKLMYCVVCQAPPKENETKKMCGPCGICRGCDTQLKMKQKSSFALAA